MNFKHFIITRFNLPLGKAGIVDKNNITTQNLDWLTTRYELFDNYCFPTIYRQTNKDFLWLCFFDLNTPEKFKSKNDNYHKRFENFIPIYLTKEESLKFLDIVHIETLKRSPNADYILTTRMDNDDSLAYNAIELIQNSIKTYHKTNTYIINPLNGVQYYEEYNCSLIVKWKASHFLTMIASKDINDNVYSIKHTDVSKKYIVKQLRTKNPLWMEVCHKNNLVNDVHLKWLFCPIETNILSCFQVANLRLPRNTSILYFRFTYLYPRILRKIKNKLLYGK